MKKLKSKVKTCSKKCFISASLLLSTLILIIMIIAINFIVRGIKDNTINLVDNVKENRLTQFDIAYDKLVQDAQISSNNASSIIEETVLNEYKYNMNDLKDNLSDKNYKDLSDLIAESVTEKYMNVDSSDNTLFVATADGVICDFNYDINSIYAAKEDYHSWQNIIGKSVNKENCELIVSLLLNRTMEPIIYLNKKVPNKYDLSEYDGKRIDQFEFKRIYKKYGLDILKYFEILVPSYITDDGDIFGQKDITHGERRINYKIIVVQRFNVYDQIKFQYPNIIENVDNACNIHDNTDKILCAIYVITILITISIIIITIHFCMIFNSINKNKGSDI